MPLVEISEISREELIEELYAQATFAGLETQRLSIIAQSLPFTHARIQVLTDTLRMKNEKEITESRLNHIRQNLL